MKQNKYQYLKILQGQYDGIWSDILAFGEKKHVKPKEMREVLNNYMENDPRPYRIVNRRIPAGVQFHA